MVAVVAPTAADTTKRNGKSDLAARAHAKCGPFVGERMAAGAKPHNSFHSGGLKRAM
jgi:hypothetical protein